MEQSQLPARSNAFNFVEESMQTLEGALKYANTLLASKLCPRHFYELKKDSSERTVPDYTKGKPEAVLIVLQHGREVGMSISQSLQQIVPINGLISIKGDGAKSLIFGSGKLERGTWVERTTGSIATNDLRVSITAKRSDNGVELTRSFSVEAAMRAGLWVTEGKIKGKDAWKYLLSPWYRYPERMIKYRALGFISRDLFPDVLMGMVTEEEAIDYPVDEGTTTIKKPDGTELKIERPTHKQERSQDITDETVKKIDKLKGGAGITADSPTQKLDVKMHKEKELLDMGPKIYKLAETIILSNYENKKLSTLLEELPGKKSNKKYREAILALQTGKFLDLLDKYGVQRVEDKISTQGQDTDVIEHDEVPSGPIDETMKTDEDIKNEKEQTNFDKQFTGKDEKNTKKAQVPSETNKQGIKIPALGETGSREFEDVKVIYDALNDYGVDNDRWLKITKGHEFGDKYTNKEEFCRRASVNEINSLLNSL